MKRLALVALALTGVWACSSGPSDSDMAADTLSRAKKDSIVSELPIPGAGGVGAAMRARDQANAKVEAHDTLN